MGEIAGLERILAQHPFFADMSKTARGLIAGCATNQVFHDGERIFRSRTGNAGMATAGAGDALSGLLGALLARGMQPFDAACLAAHAHGVAGDLAREARGIDGVVASDLCDRLGEALA